ncbi:MAG: GNAT family N-acetyltransferase [Myxococcota bacterium]|nr:GNAT family N-acetyltransferase [Myxococcota bacterium]
MSHVFAEVVTKWEYQPPYGLYNHAPEKRPVAVEGMTDPANSFSAILEAPSTLVGFCCFGSNAQVPGGDYSREAVDIGMGIDPKRTGRGFGHLVARAVLEHADETRSPGLRRVTVATFNVRAIRVWARQGFVIDQDFQRPGDGRRFTVLTR